MCNSVLEEVYLRIFSVTFLQIATMAFPGLLEGQRNQPKPHADLFPRSWSKLLLTL